ncbi:MAG: J domain-containing protein [Spongiibacteraceae bacterium]|nr:J domain-containing protein [Spongiibacteraceae bacterium]
MTTPAYPLQWPTGRPRARYPERSRFDTVFTVARDSLFLELERLNAGHTVLSTNIELRLDGLPYANRRQPEDTGVAVYFTHKGQQMCFACDRWDMVKDNIQTVRKTIEALRGIARWGTGDMMQKAFEGFQALPSPDSTQRQTWWQVLGVYQTARPDAIKAAHRKLAKQHHADTGADGSMMADVNAARDEGMRNA